MSKKLSIIICTYNRAKFLEYALESLVKQTQAQESFEVLVIDNNSSDKTKDIYQKFKGKLPLKYFLEKKQGLSNARNRGLQESKTSYLAYLDDDAKTSKGWVKKIIEIINEKNPDIIGGPILPYYIEKKEEWYKDEYEIRRTINGNGFLNKEQLVSGSNFIIKKDLLEKVGGFNPELGMQGKSLGFGEETKVILDCWKLNKNLKVYYDQNILVYHYVKPSRMIIFERLKGSYISGMQHHIITNENTVSFIKAFIMSIGILSFILLRSVRGFFLRGKGQKVYKNFILEEISPLFYKLGKYNSYLKENKK